MPPTQDAPMTAHELRLLHQMLRGRITIAVTSLRLISRRRVIIGGVDLGEGFLVLGMSQIERRLEIVNRELTPSEVQLLAVGIIYQLQNELGDRGLLALLFPDADVDVTRAGRAERTGSAGRAERTGSAGRAERTGSAGRVERTGSAGRTGSVGRTDSAGRAGRAGSGGFWAFLQQLQSSYNLEAKAGVEDVDEPQPSRRPGPGNS